MPEPCNQDALNWINLWPEWPHHCLIITGSQGCGKTHLAHVWAERSVAHIVTTADLTSGDIRAIIPPSRALVLDDASGIAGNAAQEETLFHFFNIMREVKGHMLITATKAPAQWGIMLPDLRSRLCAAPAVAIMPPDDVLLSAMLLKQFLDRQINLGSDVLDYILPRIERSAAAVGRLVDALDRASLAEQRGITIALARRVLDEQHSLFADNPLE